MTTIRYFIPEDGDTEFSPNVYLAPKKASNNNSSFAPRLGDIKQSFPLPGKYHFRFKTALVPGTDREKGAVPVWMDCVDDNQYVGVWRNSIIAKVTRISMDEDDDDFDRMNGAPLMNGHVNVQSAAPPKQAVSSHHSSAAPSPNTSQHGVVHAEEKLLDVFDDTPSVSTNPTPPTSTHTSTGNLLDVDPTPAPPAPAASTGLLDLDTPVYNSNTGHHQPAQTNTHHNDFLGMTAPAATNMGGVYGVAQHQQQPQQQPQPRAIPQINSQQQPMRSAQLPNKTKSGGSGVFDTFTNKQSPFGGLEWR